MGRHIRGLRWQELELTRHICEEEYDVECSGGGSYSWSTGQTVGTITVLPTITTTYYLTITGTSYTCYDEAVVYVNSKPPIDAGEDVSICRGGSAILRVTGGISYSWSTGSTVDSILVSPTVNTSYRVTGYDEKGCSNVDTVLVGMILPPISGGSNQTICRGSSTLLVGSGGESYSWSTGSEDDSIIVSPTVTTTYRITGYDGGDVVIRRV
jgi:hypothetical protein